MTRRLSVLVSKEVRELVRDPKIILVMILVPSLMFIFMGEAVGFASKKTAEEILRGVDTAFVDGDGGWASDLLYSIARSAPVSRVDRVEAPPGEDVAGRALELAASGRYDLVIAVPSGFTENITSARPAEVLVYSVVRGLSVAAGAKPGVVTSLLESYKEHLVKQWLRRAFPDKDPDVLLNPFTVVEEAVVKGRPLPQQALSMLMSQSFLLFLGPLILLSMAASIAAASIGVEKEEKTLETLLSLPIRGRDVLFSKAIATLIVAVIGTASLSLGFTVYMRRVLSMPLEIAGQAGAAGAQLPEPSGGLGFSQVLGILGAGTVAVAVVGVFLSIMLVLLLSIVVSSLAGNVREAQAIAGYIWLPLFIPLFAMMFLNISSLGPLGQAALALLPFATPLVALKASFEGVSWIMYASLAANLAYSLLVLLLGARWFEGEKILTARIRTRRKGLIRGLVSTRRK